MATTPTSTSASMIEEENLLTSISSTATASTPAADNATASKKTETSAQSTAARSTVPKHIVSHLNQHYVDHSYTDYAYANDDDLRLMKKNSRSRSGGAEIETKVGATITKTLLGMSCSYGPMKSKGHGGRVKMPFPGKGGASGLNPVITPGVHMMCNSVPALPCCIIIVIHMVVPSLSFKPQLLEVLDRGDLTSIIDWMPHGRAFIVKQPKVFTAQVLSRFFKQTKFMSFTRQINLWGFKRITRGIDAGAYYHALFLPGRPNLAMRMKRKKIKGTGTRPIPNPEQEPNFYHQYRHVGRVQRSGVPIPLPPLPSEMIANLMHDGGGGDMNALDQSVVQQQPVLLGSPILVPQHASTLQSSFWNGLGSRSTMNSGLSVASLGLAGLQGEATTDSRGASPNKLDAMRAALADEFRLQGLMKPSDRLHPPSTSSYSTLLGFPNVNNGRSNNIVFSESSSTSSPTTGLDLASSLYFRRAGMSALAPRSFHPVNNVQDKVSSAYRRHVERLLDQATSAPEGILCHAAPESTSLRHPSYQESTQTRWPSYRDLHEASLLGHDSAVSSPAARRESFKLHQSSHHTAAAAAPISSLFGSYLPSPQSRPALSSRMTTQDINMLLLVWLIPSLSPIPIVVVIQNDNARYQHGNERATRGAAPGGIGKESSCHVPLFGGGAAAACGVRYSRPAVVGWRV
eukprot:CAMPEP_0201903948 /NCGR_PEP_ID=MMETSP0902-20130614/55746_1 /ASSEMBLY_ACC=CAM_ASM_000551 /TAXON_ID=420261 /ORGANISM="Thalassiosira antarctica, Strain CCMP982" /LENGTH=686 /DNA_ID=CAMNT_0048438017 /DNA_START=13 /DNA_END=2074 /DNA_ORIENTATION=+